MLFNSFEFVLFIALFFAGWPLLKKNPSVRWGYLVAASFFFYGWWDWRFLFLILASGFIDFFAALAMDRWPQARRFLLGLSILGNVGLLGTFKYFDFFLEAVNAVGGAFGATEPLPLANLVLPIGISFYTFQSMSYTIDVYRGNLRPTANVLHFFAYLAMFPQLVAGPIVRAADLLPQLAAPPRVTEQQRWDGTTLIVFGFFKKVVVADSLAGTVNNAFLMAEPLESAAYWWIIMIMFSFQIYCDFSGYTDIARGLGKWMGYEYPRNFRHPYISTSFREFWTRWHISLSTWFRDYVYIPLGGSRGSESEGMRNMWIAMVVSGLWHGAAWTFVVWGALHALYLSIERVTKWPDKMRTLPGGRHASAVIVFMLVLIAWVYFRALSFGQAQTIIVRLFDLSHWNLARALDLMSGKALLLTALMALRQVYVHLFGEPETETPRFPLPEGLQPALLAGLLTACVFFRGPGEAFIYFQF